MGDQRSRYLAVGGANILDTACERLSPRVRKFSRILQPTATLVPVHDSATSAERAPLFDKAVFRKATCTPVGSHFQKRRHARSCFSVQALCFCIVFLDHVKYLQIHATSAASTLADWHTQKIHACSEVGCRPTLIDQRDQRIQQLY